MADRPGALSLGWRSIRRQLGSESAVMVSIVVALLVSAFLLTAAPRLLESVSADDLNTTVSEPPAAQRNMRVEREIRIRPGPDTDPLAPVRAQGESFADRSIPPAVSAVISDHYYVVDSPEFSVTPLPGEEPPHPFRTYLRFRHQEHIEDRIDLIEGAMPAPQDPVRMLVGSECPLDADEREQLTAILDGEDPAATDDLDCRLDDVPHFQMVVSEQTSADLGYGIGDLMLLRPDPTDPLFFGLSMQDLDYPLVASISGIARFSDAEDEYWYGDTSLHRPAIQENADLRIIFATGLMSPDDYATMLRATGEAERLYTWRHFVSPELVENADIHALMAELIPFQLRYSGILALPTEPRVVTQLSDLLTEHLEQRDETVSLLSIAVAGLLSVAIAVILLLGVLMTVRQRHSVVLTRSRGASAGQLTLTRLYEALLLTAPSVVIGYLIADAVLPDTDGLVPYRAAVALASGASAVLVGAGWPMLRRRLGALQGRERALPKPTPRRVVGETLVIILAVGSVVLLRRRGGIEDPTSASRFDLLLAIAPVLIGWAVGLVVARLYPVAISGLSWLGSRARGVVTFVGFRRVLLQSRLPVLVILLCISAATYSWSLQTSIEDGQQVSSWQLVGADYSVKGFGTGVALPSSVDLADLGPIDQIAYGRSFARATARSDRNRAGTEVLAIDSPAYSSLTAGTPGDADLPEFMVSDPLPNIGGEDNPIPAIVSRNWPSGVEFALGDVFTLDLGNLDPTVEVRQLRDHYPDLPADRPFVVFDLTAIEAFSEFPLAPTVAYLRAERGAEPTLRANLAEQSTSAILTSRYDTLDSIAEDPFIDWAGQILTTVFIFSGVFAAVAAIATSSIAAAARTRDFAYLRTLGLDERQSTLMTIIEQFPSLLVGTLVGVFTGVVITRLLEPALTLDVFTGSVVPSPLTTDWVALGVMTLALLGLLGMATVIFVLVNRRTRVAAVLRIGDE